VRRRISYQWRLRQVMAEHGMFTITELVPLLAERGITLSASQVHRLVSGVPERLSLHVLAALCDIFDTTPAQLIVTDAENMAPRQVAAGGRTLCWRPPRTPRRSSGVDEQLVSRLRDVGRAVSSGSPSTVHLTPRRAR
jgi:DNA-binding Xre family transcriptional regulator